MQTLAELCKDKILREIGGLNWLRKYVAVPKTALSGEVRMECIVHDDNTPSLQFNSQSGLWQCFGCGAKGDLVDFWYRLGGTFGSKQEAIRSLAIELGILEDITDETVQNLEERLWHPGNWKVQQTARDWFRISDETLKRFRIGFHVNPKSNKARFAIPIKGRSGFWEDVRLYHKDAQAKVTSWARGHGGCRVFPLDVLLKEDLVCIFEGEKDCLRAQDFSIQGAICFTGGADAIPEDAHELFKGKTVYICYDVDDKGRGAGEQLARVLSLTAREVRIIALPPEGLPENGDFSDWANLGRSLDDWFQLMQSAFRVEPPAGYQQTLAESVDDYLEIDFARITVSPIYNRPIRFLARATGVSVGLPQYQIPQQIVVDCPRNLNICKHCRIHALDPLERPWELEIDLNQEHALKLFRCSGDAQDKAVRSIFGIHHECRVATIKPKTRVGVQTVMATPPVDMAEMRDDYGSAARLTSYYHGPAIEDNRDYWFYGYLQPDPKSQMGILNLHRADPARNAIDTFQLNDLVLEAVEWFRPEPWETIADHISDLHRIIEREIGIWGRHDIQHAVLEVAFSAIEFYVGKRHIHNGWIENLLIGDTRSGKSQTAKRIQRFLNVGEFITGEMVTTAGLIGGVETVDKVGMIKWGAWPRNDRGMIVIDEIDEMSRNKDRDCIGQLSATRSEGRAVITKMISGSRPARVRSLWITNPKNGRKISTFNGGVRAIPGIFESRQDIARFTKAYAVATDDVSIDVITQTEGREQHEKRHLWNALAILVWSLQSPQIHFTEDAVKLLTAETKRLCKKYHDGIPLVEKGSMLDKIARLCVPTASLCGSFEQRGELMHLVIHRAHVEYTVSHLEATYDSPAMRYNQYSEMMYEASKIGNEREVLDTLGSIPEFDCEKEPAIRYFLTHHTFSLFAFQEFIGDRGTAARVWACLLRNNCLEHDVKLELCQKTAAFAELLEREMGGA